MATAAGHAKLASQCFASGVIRRGERGAGGASGWGRGR
jgi:hypothetical protein